MLLNLIKCALKAHNASQMYEILPSNAMTFATWVFNNKQSTEMERIKTELRNLDIAQNIVY